jgi:hypothetical protein
MTSRSDDANDANFAQNPGEDEKDLIDEKFRALVSGLSLDESSPSTYLDELDRSHRNVDEEHFTPPVPEKVNRKRFFTDAVNAFKKWKDNPRSDNSGLDDDGAQI